MKFELVEFDNGKFGIKRINNHEEYAILVYIHKHWWEKDVDEISGWVRKNSKHFYRCLVDKEIAQNAFNKLLKEISDIEYINSLKNIKEEKVINSIEI